MRVPPLLLALLLVAATGAAGCTETIGKTAVEEGVTPIANAACACQDRDCALKTVDDFGAWVGKQRKFDVDEEGHALLQEEVKRMYQCWVKQGVDEKKFAELDQKLARKPDSE